MAGSDPWEYQAGPSGYPTSPYPVSSIGNALANAIDAYGNKKRKDKYTTALANALAPQPVGDVAITPNLTSAPTSDTVQSRTMAGAYNQPSERDIFSKLLDTGNPDVTAQFGPLALQSQIQSQAQANAPITPYQRANLARETDTAKAAREATAANLLAGREATAANLTANREDRAFQAEQQRQFLGAQGNLNRQARIDAANATAANQGLFGRGMEGRSYNILAKGLTDEAYRSTPEYITAWQIASNPKVDPATGTVVVPDLSNFKPPGQIQGQQQLSAPGAPQVGAAGQQRMPSVQSFAPPNPSQAEAQSAGFANRLDAANTIFDDPKISSAGQSLMQRGMSEIPGVGNYAVTPEYQQFDQAARNFINAQLRRESGAVISPAEFADARKQYLPGPGDGEAVLKQKKANRDLAVRNMQLSAGNVLMPPGVIQQSSPAKGSPVVPMSQGFAPQAKPAPSSGALSPQEQQELDALRARFGKKP